MHLPKAPAEGLTTPRLGKGGRTAPDFRGNHVGEAEKRRDRGGGTGHGGVGRGEGGGQAESLGCGVHSALFGVLSFRKPKCYHIPKWAKGTLNRALDGWLNVTTFNIIRKEELEYFLTVTLCLPWPFPGRSQNSQLLGSTCFILISLLRPPGAIQWLLPFL